VHTAQHRIAVQEGSLNFTAAYSQSR